jgi:hypothetical protein
VNTRSSRHVPASPGRWVPAVAAAGLLGAVVVAGVAGSSSGGTSSDPTDVSTTSLAVVAEATTTVPAVVTVATSAPVQKTPLSQTLSSGMVGDEVTAVQARLKELGFDPGPIDGIFGKQTTTAVWAFEKLVMGTPRDDARGQVTPDIWSRMQDPIAIRPRRSAAQTTPNHTEIYLPQQVLAVFHGDTPVLVTHISSGDGQDWCEEVTISPGEQGNEQGTEPLKRGECGKSITPGGVFTYERFVEGRRDSALGGMWNPAYFNYGIAVHGALNVPLQPASHGCIRIPMAISDYYQDLVAKGDQVFVWNGVDEPEEVTRNESLPYFNRIDPNYSTTTTSTTTTTTTPPTTVPAPTTTKPPPATTTTTTTTTSTTPPTTLPPA